MDFLENGGTTEEYNKEKIALEKFVKSDKIVAGARILDPDSEKGKAFAKMYYEEIKSYSTDAARIANNTGYSVEDIKRIKEYLFFNPSFAPDCAMAHSWQRLMQGKDIQEHDELLLLHELYEMELKKNNPNMTHSEAHTLATKKYDYQKAVGKYYGNLNKRKKTK